MDIQLISDTYNSFTHFNIGMPFCGAHRTKINNNLIKISQDIESDEILFSQELFRLKDMLFQPNGFINLIPYGEIIAILKYLNYKCNNPKNEIWSNIHPQIERVSKRLFLNGHFANAAEDAFIEINARVKKIYHKIEPSKPIPDGREVMNKVFAYGEKAMIEVCDRPTENGNNIHEGTRFMLVGAMSALRNPKAHSNTVVITQEECVRRLMFASMLMYKIDEVVAYCGISE